MKILNFQSACTELAAFLGTILENELPTLCGMRFSHDWQSDRFTAQLQVSSGALDNAAIQDNMRTWSRYLGVKPVLGPIVPHGSNGPWRNLSCTLPLEHLDVEVWDHVRVEVPEPAPVHLWNPVVVGVPITTRCGVGLPATFTHEIEDVTCPDCAARHAEAVASQTADAAMVAVAGAR